jgi:hypothetical protein
VSASTAGALKAFLEAQSLGIAVYRDQAPENQALPYVIVNEAVAMTPDALEDGASGTVREEVTVDVWMAWKDVTTGLRTESYTLPSAVARVLQGARLNVIGTAVVYAVVVIMVGPRIVTMEDIPATVHVPIQADVMRVL